jgi:hypothetical protein
MKDENSVIVVEEGGDKPRTSGERLWLLYDEAQALKMSSIRKYLKISGSEEQEGEAQKLSQIVLKAIDLQLRILSEDDKRDDRSGLSPSVDVIWDVMSNLPEVKAILGREEIRDALIAALEERSDQDE